MELLCPLVRDSSLLSEGFVSIFFFFPDAPKPGSCPSSGIKYPPKSGGGGGGGSGGTASVKAFQTLPPTIATRSFLQKLRSLPQQEVSSAEEHGPLKPLQPIPSQGRLQA
jgi:hypothetical protein